MVIYESMHGYLRMDSYAWLFANAHSYLAITHAYLRM